MGTKCSNFVYGSLKSVFLLTVILFLTNLTSFAAPGKINFTGKWSLNESKSTLSQGGGGFGPAKMLNITQEGNNLTVERTTNRNGEDVTTTLKYTLDGKECDNSNERRTSKSVLSWSDDGKALTITTNSVSERDGQKFESKNVEVWKMAEGGKSFTIDQVMNSPRGERKSNLVYDKN
jgi:dipeptidyl aminopeptidase/acylaminoacyl peptidase